MEESCLEPDDDWAWGLTNERKWLCEPERDVNDVKLDAFGHVLDGLAEQLGFAQRSVQHRE